MNESINLAKRLANVFLTENEHQESSVPLPEISKPQIKENGNREERKLVKDTVKRASNIENSDPTQLKPEPTSRFGCTLTHSRTSHSHGRSNYPTTIPTTNCRTWRTSNIDAIRPSLEPDLLASGSWRFL
jgi:hypothetical protein